MRSPMLLIKVVTVYGSLLNKTQWRGWRACAAALVIIPPHVRKRQLKYITSSRLRRCA